MSNRNNALIIIFHTNELVVEYTKKIDIIPVNEIITTLHNFFAGPVKNLQC